MFQKWCWCSSVQHSDPLLFVPHHYHTPLPHHTPLPQTYPNTHTHRVLRDKRHTHTRTHTNSNSNTRTETTQTQTHTVFSTNITVKIVFLACVFGVCVSVCASYTPGLLAHTEGHISVLKHMDSLTHTLTHTRTYAADNYLPTYRTA